MVGATSGSRAKTRRRSLNLAPTGPRGDAGPHSRESRVTGGTCEPRGRTLQRPARATGDSGARRRRVPRREEEREWNLSCRPNPSKTSSWRRHAHSSNARRYTSRPSAWKGNHGINYSTRCCKSTGTTSRWRSPHFGRTGLLLLRNETEQTAVGGKCALCGNGEPEYEGRRGRTPWMEVVSGEVGGSNRIYGRGGTSGRTEVKERDVRVSRTA